MLECSYCGGEVVRDEEIRAYVHTTDGDRVKPGGPGDFASAAHNQAGSRVNPADVVEKGQS